MILFQQVTVSGNTHNNKSRGKKNTEDPNGRCIAGRRVCWNTRILKQSAHIENPHFYAEKQKTWKGRMSSSVLPYCIMLERGKSA